MSDPFDPVTLTADLVRCPSVTPAEAGALDLLERHLSEAGFECTRVRRGNTDNLFARWGPKAHPQTFGFNGHIDVVPIGDAADWSIDPFGAVEAEGKLWGRGSTDMKSGVAAFVAAAIDHARRGNAGPIVLTLTGDEEGPATDGTAALLDWMDEHGEAMNVCLVGEPTCPNVMGEVIKIGRRGSLNARFTAKGVQGHSAYPHRANNPLTALTALCHRLATHSLDTGTGHFDPSTLALTSIDTGNTATNVIPAQSTAAVNIRFNDQHSGASLTRWLETAAAEVAGSHGLEIDCSVHVTGEAFLTPPGPFSDLISAAVELETGQRPLASTSGGTSDARFVKNHCPVVEFGLVGRTMHQVDEHVEIDHIRQLKAIYARILTMWFA